jgi:hypothetical protein
VHSGAFADGAGEADRQAALDDLAAKYDARPRWVLPRFVW